METEGFCRKHAQLFKARKPLCHMSLAQLRWVWTPTIGAAIRVTHRSCIISLHYWRAIMNKNTLG